MRCRPRAFAAAVAVALAAPAPAPAADGSGWMAAIPDACRRGAFSIPGTHDTCALHETVPNTARCQGMALPEQLAAGVRYLDIRCRHVGNRFAIYHGIEDQRITFEEVLRSVIAFLDAHPTETVLLSVKEEHVPEDVTRAFWQTFEQYHARDSGRWFVGESLPELGSVRGKIVLVRRFGTEGTVRGLDATAGWANNHRGTMSVGTQFRVQDWYRLPDLEPASVDAKWGLALGLLREADAGGGARMAVNHLSGFRMFLGRVPTGITQLADAMRDRLRLELLASPRRNAGTLLLDFATPDVVQLVFRSGIQACGGPCAEERPDLADGGDAAGGDGVAADPVPAGPSPDPAPWIDEHAVGAVIAWEARPGRSYRVMSCGIDPSTHAFIDWHPVMERAGQGCVSVFAPVGSDGAPLPTHLRRWRVEAEPGRAGRNADLRGR